MLYFHDVTTSSHGSKRQNEILGEGPVKSWRMSAHFGVLLELIGLPPCTGEIIVIPAHVPLIYRNQESRPYR